MSLPTTSSKTQHESHQIPFPPYHVTMEALGMEPPSAHLWMPTREPWEATLDI